MLLIERISPKSYKNPAEIQQIIWLFNTFTLPGKIQENESDRRIFKQMQGDHQSH